VNKEEALTVQKEILASCNGLTENAIMLVFPGAEGSMSHGYQLHIMRARAEMLKENLSCLKAIARKHYLTINELRKDVVVIYRPCFIDYSSRGLL